MSHLNIVLEIPINLLRQGFEKENDCVFQDLLRPGGFVTACRGVLRLVELGLFYGAVPCSSYVFMSAGTHHRSATSPWGEEKLPFVYDGNALGCRFMLLCLLAIVRNVKWMIENPRCTHLSLLPPLKYILAKPIGGQFANWSDTQCHRQSLQD